MGISIIGFMPETSSLSFLLKKEGKFSINGNPYLNVLRYPVKKDNFSEEPEWNDFLTEKSLFLKGDYFELPNPVIKNDLEKVKVYVANIWQDYSQHPELQSFKQKIWGDGNFTEEEFSTMVTRMVEIVQALFKQNLNKENGLRNERVS